MGPPLVVGVLPGTTSQMTQLVNYLSQRRLLHLLRQVTYATASKVKYTFHCFLVILIVTAPPCPANQCFGRGTCTSTVVLGFQCTCTFPYVGERCQDIDASTFTIIGGDDATDVKSVLIPAILIPIVVVLIVLAAVVFVVLLVLLRRQNSKNSEVEKKDDEQQSAYENIHLDKTPSRKELL